MGRLLTGLLALALLWMPGLSIAADTGVVFIDTPLHTAPLYSARSTATVRANTQVEVISSQGLWLHVKLPPPGGHTGWVRRFDVRLAGDTASRPKSSSGLGSLFGGLFGGGSQRKTEVTATIGIRGLDTEDLKAAKPNPAELERMKKYTATRAQAEAMARRARLKSRSMDYLQATAANTHSSGGTTTKWPWQN